MPCPRIRTADRPSSCRRVASRDGRCLRLANGGSDRIDAAHRQRPLPGPDPERSEAPDRHPVGEPVAPPGRAQGRREPAPLAARQPQPVSLTRRARRGLPRVPEPAAQRPPGGVGDEKGGGPVGARGAPGPRVRAGCPAGGAHGDREVEQRHGDADPDPEQDHLPGGLDDDGHHAEQEQQREPPTHRHGDTPERGGRVRKRAGRIRNLSGGPARSRWRWPARTRPRRPRARPPAAARAGARAWRGRAP